MRQCNLRNRGEPKKKVNLKYLRGVSYIIERRSERGTEVIEHLLNNEEKEYATVTSDNQRGNLERITKILPTNMGKRNVSVSQPRH